MKEGLISIGGSAELGQESQASSCLRKGTPLASRDSTRFDEMKEGLISIGGRNLRLPLHF